MERVERTDAQPPSSGLMLESAKDAHSPPPAPGARGGGGFHLCWKMNLIFLPQEEGGSNTDKMQPLN